MERTSGHRATGLHAGRIMITKKGQNILEYSLLIALVLSAILIMQVYVKRAYQGRIKQEADNLGEQYSPKHTTSTMVTRTNIKSESCIGGTCKGKEVPEGMNVSFADVKSEFERKEAVDSFAAEK